MQWAQTVRLLFNPFDPLFRVPSGSYLKRRSEGGGESVHMAGKGCCMLAALLLDAAMSHQP